MKLKIENLKHIRSLEFELPPKGVWLLTGLNGSGKTSLLAALYRIKNSTAYQKYFRTSALNNYDSFIDSKISYTINHQTVTYKYSGQRWSPTPSKYSNLFNEFPYPAVNFIEVNAKRVEPSLHDIQAQPRVRSVNSTTIDFLKTVLNDTKWANLKFINYTRGIGNRAYLIPYQKGGFTHYYSEKNFSLGELCILRLACALENIQNNSLILIDEIEIALHPKAQINLLKKLKDIASQKNLTIIFSTHSATLIKSSEKNKILYLEQMGTKKYVTQKNIYPAKILGEMAYDEELDLDYLFLVEDEQAKLLLIQIIEKYKLIKSKTSNIPFTPSYRVIPIGGFKQVMDVLASTSQIFKDLVKRKAFLDLDAHATIHDSNQSYLQQFNTLSQNIKFLPCTPEKGVIDLIHSDTGFVSMLNGSFDGCILHIENWISHHDYQNLVSTNNREQAKKRMTYLVNKIHDQTGCDLTTIRKNIYKAYTDNFYSNTGSLMAYLGPVFN